MCLFTSVRLHVCSVVSSVGVDNDFQCQMSPVTADVVMTANDVSDTSPVRAADSVTEHSSQVESICNADDEAVDFASPVNVSCIIAVCLHISSTGVSNIWPAGQNPACQASISIRPAKPC